MWCGIDPSLTGTALAVFDDHGHLDTWRCPTRGTIGDTHRDTMVRLDRIERWLRDRLDELARVDLTIGIEGPSLAPKRTGHDHERAGLWWRLFTRADQYADRDVLVVPPATLKKYATGKGNATKDQVLMAVTRRYTTWCGDTNDEADAVVLAALLARMDDQPVEGTLPAAHLAALDKLRSRP